MIFRSQFRVQASQSVVSEFHRRGSSMGLITPPPVFVQVRHAPEQIQEGNKMDFTLWLGPLPVHWLAQFEQVSDLGFNDRQLQGPFRTWIHRHRFQFLQEGLTQVQDEIQIHLSNRPKERIIGLAMVLGLPFLFAFRAWKTRRLLEAQALASKVKARMP